MSRRGYLAIALWIAALAAAAFVFDKLPSTADGYRDFATYYVRSLATRRGINPYAGDFETVYTEAGRPLGDVDMGTNHLGDTPAWFGLFEPLTFLRPRGAYWTWQVSALLMTASEANRARSDRRQSGDELALECAALRSNP